MRLGLVGCGWIVSSANMVRALRGAKSVDVVAVADLAANAGSWSGEPSDSTSALFG